MEKLLTKDNSVRIVLHLEEVLKKKNKKNFYTNLLYSNFFVTSIDWLEKVKFDCNKFWQEYFVPYIVIIMPCINTANKIPNNSHIMRYPVAESRSF